MSEVISFAGWEKFRAPNASDYGLVLLSLKTGVGKTVVFPPKLVGQQRGVCIVVVPQQIHVRNNMNFHMSNSNNGPKILIQGLFHQYNKYTTGKQDGKSTLMNYKPRGNFSGEVVYITAGSFLRRLLSGSMAIGEIKYLILDEVHVTENDYCTLIQIINQISKEISGKMMPQLVLSSATLNDDVIARLSHAIKKTTDKKSVRIENEASPYFIDVRYKHTNAISETVEFMVQKTDEAVGAWFRQGATTTYHFEGNKIQPGILLHLPGKNECHEVGNAIYSKLSGIFKEGIRISYIYSGSEDVVGIYDKSEELLFNIIIATNADSGVTLPIGITIDSCLRKHVICFNNAEGNEVWSLRPVRESKSGMLQRRGRVGRTGNGVCYHCISEKEFAEALDNTTPETFRGENNELVLAILDAGYYFESSLYGALPETIQRLIDLELATPDAMKVLEQRHIEAPHVYTTSIGQKVAEIPLPVLWAKMIVEAPDEIKHAIIIIATFYSIQKHGGFFRGKTTPLDFQKRRALMGESQMDFICGLWAVCELFDTRENGHFEAAKKIGQKYCVDYKSLVKWKNDFLDVCDKMNIPEDIPDTGFVKSEVENYIAIFLHSPRLA
jgi:HrpA-like RNA helicase